MGDERKATMAALDRFMFTSESVNEGHPDKLCDQVSDAIVDACFAQDPHSRVACETCAGTNFVMVFGEITTKAKVDYEQVVRDTVKEIGFDAPEKGIDYKTCEVLNRLHAQSVEIGDAVHGLGAKKPEEVGAGDQGHMFGYATDETPEMMPLTHSLATGLGYRLTEVRKNGTLPLLRPDGKTQVTVEYKKLADGGVEPIRVHTVVISTQHDPAYTQEQLKKDLMEHVIKAVVPAKYLDDDTIYHLNPSGLFTIGGPEGAVVSLAARLSSTLMVDGALMVEVPSLARIPPKWIALPRMGAQMKTSFRLLRTTLTAVLVCSSSSST